MSKKHEWKVTLLLHEKSIHKSCGNLTFEKGGWVTAWCNSMSFPGSVYSEISRTLRGKYRWGSVGRRQMGKSFWCQHDFCAKAWQTLKVMEKDRNIEFVSSYPKTHEWKCRLNRDLFGHLRSVLSFPRQSHHPRPLPLFLSHSKKNDKMGWLWRGAWLPW